MGCPGTQRLEDVEQLTAGGGVEAGTDLAHVTQLAVLVRPEQQRTEAAAALALALGPAADHDVLGLDDLDLAPVR